MKRKLILFLSMISLLFCLFAISVSAAELANYASVKLTLVDGTEEVGYCEINGRFLRDNVYKNPKNTGDGVYAWGDIKVFDMRDSVIVGDKTYNEVGGLNCNSQAVNVEEYYFSSQVTKILNTTFTKDWTSLKTVYLPKTVTEIDRDAFKESAVHQVIIEEGSQLKSIGNNAFQDCSNLETFDFPEGLESLGYNCFWKTGLSGTIVIPNSVTFLDAGSLLSTKIENLYLGDGALRIGHNFLGTYGQIDNAYLKSVYISASTTFTQTNIFYKCANPVNFYIIGTDAECEAMVNTLKGHDTGKYMTFITADEATESTDAGYGIIHTGYNRCDAFYDGEHLNDTNPCVINCSRCETYGVAKENPVHKEKVTTTYESWANGTIVTTCENEGCKHEITENAPALFKISGFSTPTEYGKKGLAIGFEVNEEALSAYRATGKTLTFGAYVVGCEKLGANDVYTFDGAVKAEVTESELTYFSMKVTGFSTEEQMNAKLCLGAYVVENGDVSYLQAGEAIDGCNFLYTTYNLAYANSSNK